MKMSTENGVNFLGSDTKSRQVGCIVPASHRSSSNDGPSAELRASSAEENVIAQRGRERDMEFRPPADGKGDEATSAKGSSGKAGPQSYKDELAIKIARKYTEGLDSGTEEEEEVRVTAKKGVTTRSGTKDKGASRSKSLDKRRRGNRARKDSSDSEKGNSRSRPRRGRNAEEVLDEEKQTASETEHEKEEEIIVVEEEGLPCMNKENMGQVRRIMTEAELMVKQMEVRDDCPSLSANIRREGGQGRPAVTGGRYIKQLQKAYKELTEKARELRKLREAIIPANLSHNRKIEEKLAMEELRDAPAEVLPAVILEAVNGLDLVLEKCTLKGEYRGKMNKSAGTIKAALTLLVQRYEHPVTGRERDAEIEVLRSKLAAQEEKLVALHQAKAQNMRMQRELQDLQIKVAELQATGYRLQAKQD